jgi:hypothetical protein
VYRLTRGTQKAKGATQAALSRPYLFAAAGSPFTAFSHPKKEENFSEQSALSKFVEKRQNSGESQREKGAFHVDEKCFLTLVLSGLIALCFMLES